MKFWEMIKELTENPEKKFKSQSGILVKVEDGVLTWQGVSGWKTSKAIVGLGLFDAEWEEVKEPVSFIEAVKTGKRIKPCRIIPKHFTGGIHGIALRLGEFQDLPKAIYSLMDYSNKEIEEYITNIKWHVE